MVSGYGGRSAAGSTGIRTLVVVVLVIAVAVVLIVRERNDADAQGVTAARPTEDVSPAGSCAGEETPGSTSCGIGGTCIKRGSFVPTATGGENVAVEADAVPRLLDLGADKCVPCKAMAPILDEMKRDFDGRLDVDVVDVWKNPDYAREYGVKVIPTQIFLDPDGTELFRHQGFLSREDILAKWSELGYPLEG